MTHLDKSKKQWARENARNGGRSFDNHVSGTHLYQDIVVPLDGTPFSETILTDAMALAEAFGATCHLVRAVPTFYHPTYPLLNAGAVPFLIGTGTNWEKQNIGETKRAEEYLLDIGRHLMARDIRFTTHTDLGTASMVILHRAKSVNADLILIASHKRTGLVRWLMPNTATDVSLAAECPVMVLPGDEQSHPFTEANLCQQLLDRLKPHSLSLARATDTEVEVMEEAVPRALGMLLSALVEERLRGPSLEEVFEFYRDHSEGRELSTEGNIEKPSREELEIVSEVFHHKGTSASAHLAGQVDGLDGSSALALLAILCPVVLTEMESMARDCSELRQVLKAALVDTGPEVRWGAEDAAELVKL